MRRPKPEPHLLQLRDGESHPHKEVGIIRAEEDHIFSLQADDAGIAFTPFIDAR